MSVFYRQYRPQKLVDLVGQEAIAKVLLSQLESGKIGHGYLFFGPKGTGKTSTARIFTKAVNCEVYKNKTVNKFGEPCNKCVSCLSVTNGSHLDLIEIDAASNRGIDEIRDLREKIKLSPASSRFKVYIIDEAHMLTTEAFNALLKTLEEPPGHAIFILCTTEYGKLPQTIVSRLQKFNFPRAGRQDLERVIEKIIKSEKIKIEKESISEIAQIADGSYRDAVSILDQLSAKNNLIKLADVLQIVRVGSWNQLYKFVGYLADKNRKEAVVLIENLVNTGADISFFAKQVVLFLEKLLFIKMGIESNLSEDYSGEQIEKVRILASGFDETTLQRLMKQFLVAENEIKLYPLPQIPLVLAVCKTASEVNGQKSEVGSQKSKRAEDKLDRSKQGRSEGGLVKSVAEKNSKGSVKLIEKNWDKFLKKVKPVNAHVEALLRSTRPIEYDGDFLTLEVFYRFHKERLEEPKIAKMLDRVMEEVINKDVKMRFTLASQDARPPRTVLRSDVVEIGKEDLEEMAQEIFSK